MIEVLAFIPQALVGLLLIAAGVCGFRLQRRLRTPTPTPAPVPAAPVDAVAELLRAKDEIRKDELRRWVEAWQRAAALPDFWATIREIRETEYEAVRADRARRDAAAAAARRLALEQAQAERDARLEADRAARAAAIAAEDAHQARLAARRARYAQRRSTT